MTTPSAIRQLRLLLVSTFAPSLLVVGPGCVERLLQVRSDPPGARVYVDGADVGRTPLEHEFTHYGTVSVTLRKEGHFAHRELKVLHVPWYEVFPLDFFTELVVPWTVTDVHLVEARLTAAPESIDEEAKMEMGLGEAELEAALRRPTPGGAGGTEGAGRSEDAAESRQRDADDGDADDGDAVDGDADDGDAVERDRDPPGTRPTASGEL